VLSPGGHIIITSTESGKVIEEVDTFTCNHCQEICRTKAGRTDPTQQHRRCLHCMQLICRKPRCNKGCAPIEKKIDEIETAVLKGHAVDSLIKALG
jgi:hypothetical protein